MKYLVLSASLQSDWDHTVNCYVIPAEDLVEIIEISSHLKGTSTELEEMYPHTFPTVELHNSYGEFTYLDIADDEDDVNRVIYFEDDFEFPDTEQVFKTATIKVGKDRVYFKAWGKHTGEEAWAGINIQKLIGVNSYYQKPLLMEDSMD